MINVNLLGVLLAGVVSMIVGFAWYSPMMFAKPWMKAMGYTQGSLKKAQKEMGMLYGLSFLVSLLGAYVLSHVMALSMNFYHYGSVSTGLTTAFWMWLGFIMPVQLTGEIFGGKNWQLFAINTGYQLMAMLLMGVTVGMFM